MKNILIIGSRGYIGSRLSDYLKEEDGYLCKGTDIGFFEQGLLYQPKSIFSSNLDARDIKEKDLEGFEAVILLAGISNDPLGNMEVTKIYDPTRQYALDIAKKCKKLGIRFVFPSSCSVYGVGKGLVTEDGPTNPQTPYSLNKLQIEGDLEKIADKDFSPIVLRLATVFGPSPRIRFDLVINMFCGMAVSEKEVILNSDGQAWRPHLHIEDACQAIKCCLDISYQEGKLLRVNVGRNDNNQKILDVAHIVTSKVEGSKLSFLEKEHKTDNKNLIVDRKIQDGVDSRTYQVSFDYIHKVLPQFRAEWDLENGIGDLVDRLIFWELDSVKFKQREFYRLQQVEHLHRTGQIDDNLRIKW